MKSNKSFLFGFLASSVLATQLAVSAVYAENASPTNAATITKQTNKPITKRGIASDLGTIPEVILARDKLRRALLAAHYCTCYSADALIGQLRFHTDGTSEQSDTNGFGQDPYSTTARNITKGTWFIEDNHVKVTIDNAVTTLYFGAGSLENHNCFTTPTGIRPFDNN